MFSIKNRFFISAALGAYSYINALLVDSFTYYPIVTDKIIIFLVFIVLTVGIWEGNRLIDNYFLGTSKDNFWKTIIKQFIASVLITLLLTLLVGLPICYFTISKSIVDWILPIKLLIMFSFRINLFLNILNLIFKYKTQLDKSKIEVENYKQITTQAQLQTIKNQVNPHFLFNNLSVLSALIPESTTASVEFVNQFSKVYRYVLKSPELELITIEEELNFINSYIHLLKTRFNDGLNVEINVPMEVKSSYIVPVSLQMLIENAIKHNIISKNKPLKIEISCESLSTITVKNNLQLKLIPIEDSTKFGLDSIVKRYKFLGNDEVKVYNTTSHFSVSLPLLNMSKAG